MKVKMRSILSISVLAGSLLLSSCGDAKKEKNESVPEAKEQVNDTPGGTKDGTALAGAAFRNQDVTQAYEQYLNLKDALVHTNAATAREAAEELNNSLKAGAPEVAGIAAEIAETEDVEQQRSIFSRLTAAMDPVLKESIASGKIFKQFCPMAFEGKGDYWYSNSEEIRNPYFGDRMLKCGRVEETIE